MKKPYKDEVKFRKRNISREVIEEEMLCFGYDSDGTDFRDRPEKI